MTRKIRLHPPTPAARKPRTEDVVRDLADDILEARLPPGQRLDEQDLAARFGLSRTPVREAFGQLLAMGLVERRPNRGVVVASPSAAQLHAMFVAMAELEATMARLAALAMTPGERAALAALHRQSLTQVRAGDLEGYAAHNVAFHEALYAGAHNAYLQDLTVQTRRRLAPFRRAQFKVLGRLADSWREHDAVVAAILRADAEGAAAATRAHVSTVELATQAYMGTKETRPSPDA